MCDFEDTFGTMLLILIEIIHCDLSLDLSTEEGCNKRFQSMFLYRNTQNYH